MKEPIATKDFFMDESVKRQWEKRKELNEITERFFVDKVQKESSGICVDTEHPHRGYVILDNFTKVPSSYSQIVDDNRHLLQYDFVRRRHGELPMLDYWFREFDFSDRGRAKYIHVIMYSREQKMKEREHFSQTPERKLPEDIPWAIISLNFQDVPYPLPMKPNTLLRNALGKEFGGSGVPINKEEYEASVEFWRYYAEIR